MPGSVAAAAASTVWPALRYSRFARTAEWIVDENTYANGERQAATYLTLPRRRWDLVAKLTAAELATVRSFIEARRNVEPFVFYDPWETSPLFSHDPTGAATAGRYKVRMEPSWSYTMMLGRFELPLVFHEIA